MPPFIGVPAFVSYILEILSSRPVLEEKERKPMFYLLCLIDCGRTRKEYVEREGEYSMYIAEY